ncbi:kanadaptin-like [Asterias rubens]|uniref:kanadaptin-like n=1 Tax=Asterias rubens TaxID=7604 RepID=UPI001455C62D|nr:kanadaptin-like [Asterias rubens]
MAATMEDDNKTSAASEESNSSASAIDQIHPDDGTSVMSNIRKETSDPDTTMETETSLGESQTNTVEVGGESHQKSKTQIQEFSVSSSSVSDRINEGGEGIAFEKPITFKLPQLLSKSTLLGSGSVKNKDKSQAKSSNKKEELEFRTPDSKGDSAELQPSGKQFAFPKPKFSTRPQLPKRDAPASNTSDGSAEPTPSPIVHEKKRQEKSPAEKLAKVPPLPYKEPDWSGTPREDYHLEVLKGGSILSKIELTAKPFHVFGRLETCDIPLEHPSLSRFHLVLQYRGTGDSDRDPGFYLYDLGSTHGSWVNKQKMQGRVYYRIRVGHMFKLGGSSRMYILQGPPEDQEAESELSVKELRELRQHQLAELEERKRKKREEEEMEIVEEEKDAGISWGMEEDAEDADAMGDNPFAIMTQEEKEASYIKDPKKALRGYFEREGYDLEYNVEEKESGFNKQFVCKVELPIDDSSGRPIFAEAAVSGKKKESVLACALEACRILDAHGVLRQATHESKKRKAKDWKGDDYYDSDDDTFLDRTGVIEKKRLVRMKKAGMIKEEAQTYDSLKSQLSDVEAEIKKTENEIAVTDKKSPSVVEDDSLDAFMAGIKSGKTMDKTWRAKLKLQLIELRKEQSRLVRLVNIAKPTSMPALKKPSSQMSYAALSKKLPMFGSMKGRAGLKNKTSMPSAKAAPQPSHSFPPSLSQSNIEEEEDEQDDDGLVSPPAAKHSASESTAQNMNETSREVSAPEGKSDQAQHRINPPPARKLGPFIPIKIRKLNGQDQEESINAGEPTASSVTEEPEQSKRTDEEYREKDVRSTAETDEGSRKMQPSGRIPRGTSDEDDGRSSSETIKTGRAKEQPRKMPLPKISEDEEGMGSLNKVRTLGTEREMEEKEDKEDVAEWLPPVGQTGDGKTHLNAKFGY